MSKWVVDTCVIIDILSGDGTFSVKSADAIDAKRSWNLLSAITLAKSLRGTILRL